MGRFKTILFDFDGTVFDTVEGITKSIQYALAKHGRTAELEDLRCFAGPPLVDKFIEVYGIEKAEAEQLVIDFRERYAPVGVYESRPFPGIEKFLKDMKDLGFTLCIATSKPQAMAELLLERAGLTGFFDVIAGSLPGINNQQKYEIVERAVSLAHADKAGSVLIGDTKYDVEGAKLCGIPCIGVSWGYAAEGELEAAGAIKIADSMDELKDLLISM
jgi:phosphoglycolate phosphatase